MVNSGSRVALPLLIVVAVLASLRPSVEQVVSENSSSASEKAALLQLRSSLGIRSREWPIKEDHCAAWNGITCENGTVVGINISGFRRTRIGSLNPQFAVDALADLAKLRSFNASGFSLPGSIPDSFGQNLTSLITLDLRYCSIRNSIPSSLGNLTSLASLFLSGNALTSMIPSSLGQLVNLKVLDLSGNTLTGSIPDSFGFLQNLTILDLSSNMLSGSITPAIDTLTKLLVLNLSRNNFGSTIPEIGNLSNLIDLDLSYNSLSGSLPATLRGVNSLKRMLLGSNELSGSLTDDNFPSQNQLENIDLGRNMFSGAIPTVLWSMPKLLSLDISSNNLTGVLPANLDGNFTVSTLNMSGNLYYGNLTSVLRRFKFFDVSGNFYEGKVPSFTSKNNSLSRNCLQAVPNQKSLAECSSFYLQKGLAFDNFGQSNETQVNRSTTSRRKIIIFTAVFGGVGVILAAIFIFLLVRCFCIRSTTQRTGTTPGDVAPQVQTESTASQEVHFVSSFGEKFTLQQLIQATNNFSDSNLLKIGHSGALYKGILENGSSIVVKRVNLTEVKKKESYLVEMDIFSKVSHSRIVPFLGHYLDNENEKFLVYRYMPYQDLSSALYRKGSKGDGDDTLQSLDWITRLKIATGAAEGLCYLHECSPSIVHSDVRASSILLDDKYEVRLGSMSDASYQEADPQQSRISRFLRFPQSSDQGPSASGTATCAYDVYCFGKVLMELVTGKLGISAASDAELQTWVEKLMPFISMYEKELVTKIVDPSLLVDDDLLEEVWAMAIVARSCLNPKPSRRPPMRYIQKALENPLKVVREEATGSARLRTSSRSSWNAALTGSWRHGASDATMIVAATSGAKVEGIGSFKRSASNSQGSGHNGNENGSSRRRFSQEIFPEPYDANDAETPG